MQDSKRTIKTVMASLLCSSFVVYSPAAIAQDDADLLGNLGDTVEISEETPVGDTTSASAIRFRLESRFTAFNRRVADPSPPNAPADASARLRLVAEGDLAIAESLSFRLNAALTARFDDRGGFSAKEDLTLDLREAFFRYDMGNVNLEFGRINIRHGVATGYNPVDFFSTQNTEQRSNLDPTSARQNRLGVLALRGTYLWESGAASLTFAPKISGGGEVFHDKEIYGLHLSATNPENRVLLNINYTMNNGFAPEAFVFYDDGDVFYGLAGSVPLGDKWLLFGEWSGGPKRSLVDASLLKFRNAGQLMPALVAGFGPDQGKQTQNKLALGFSYTSASNINTTVEYHYNQAGMDNNDFDRFFALARANSANPATSGQLAGIALDAALNMQPLSKHSLFVRSNFGDILPDLDVTLMANVSLVDYSASLQAQVNYDLRDNLSLVGRIGGNLGPDNSDYGSRSSAMFAEVGLNLHF